MYRLSKKKWPILYSKLLYKMSHYNTSLTYSKKEYNILLYTFCLFFIYKKKIPCAELVCMEPGGSPELVNSLFSYIIHSE